MTAPLTLYPAIDIKGGRCVRLLRGDMARATLYGDDPARQAKAFSADGFAWLHIVDLDGAFAGATRNAAALAAILAATNAKTQLGGGLRDLDAVEKWLGLGIDRVILGTAAVKNPGFVRDAARRHPGRIVVGVDARDGHAYTDGWAGAGAASAIEVAKRFEDAGVDAIIYTDISRDGALAGVNVAATAALARAVSIPVIASGGVAGAGDIAALAAEPAGVEGVVIGRALYDGAMTAAEALSAARR